MIFYGRALNQADAWSDARSPWIGVYAVAETRTRCQSCDPFARATIDDSELQDNRSFHEFVGVPARTTTDFNPRICIKIRESGVLIYPPAVDLLFPSGATVAVQQLVEEIALLLLGNAGGDLLPATGPIGGFDRVVGAIAVDAYINPRYGASRTEPYFSIMPFDPFGSFSFDSPEWITVDQGGGVALGLRRETFGTGGGVPP